MYHRRELLLLAIFLLQLSSTSQTGKFYSRSKRSLLKDNNHKQIANNYDALCENKLCIPKCCPAGQHVFGFNKACRRAVRFKNLTFAEVPLFDSDLKRSEKKFLDVFSIVPGRILDEKFNESAYDYAILYHNYYLTEGGILHEEVPNNYDRWYLQNRSTYCIDYQLPIKKINMHYPELRFFTIIKGSDPVPDDPLITAGLLVSCFFLLLVLAVYMILPELRNLSGMVMIAYVTCLFTAFLLLATIQVKRHRNDICTGLTYLTYFSFLASFCWMNIMSCDIWWTFRGYAKARPIHRRGENFKFMMYCVYALGLPAALTVMLIVLNEIDMKHYPWFVTPNVPKRGCFLVDEEKLIYLYIPMLFLILCNWIFFLMTAFNIWRLHRATAVLDSAAAGTPAAHRSQRYRFLVYLKLSIIMGINWVLEVVSSFQPDFKGWYLSDIYNMLIGFSIFLIFVCKMKIFKMVTKRLCGGEFERRRFFKSRSSNTTTSDVSQQDTPICVNPKGQVFFAPSV